MTAALWEDTDTATQTKPLKDSVVDLRLIYLGSRFVRRSLKILHFLNIGVVPLSISILSSFSSELLDCYIALELLLQLYFLISMNFENIRACRNSIDIG